MPEVKEYVKENLPAGGRIGFDGRAMDAKTGNAYRAIAAETGGSLWTEEDLAGMAWEGRPTLSKEPVFLLQEQYSCLLLPHSFLCCQRLLLCRHFPSLRRRFPACP